MWKALRQYIEACSHVHAHSGASGDLADSQLASNQLLEANAPRGCGVDWAARG